jgi:hypothetical protein
LLVAPEPVSDEPLVQGRGGCASSLDCAEGLFCVPHVGAEYGYPAAENVCERSTLPYGFLTTGTRASRELTRDALLGNFRLPRALEEALPTRHYVGSAGESGCGAEREVACRTPDWARLWGKEATGEFSLPSKYDRFTLFGFRFANQYFDVLHRRPDRVIEEEMGPARETRQQVQQLLFSLFDSFSLSGPPPLALLEDPAPEDRNIGYRNPNGSWAPMLGQWDPAQNFRNQDGPGVVIAGAEPSAVGLNYVDLRDSLWDRHATAFRAMQFAGALRYFRGLLDEVSRARWIEQLRELGLALALPSSFEGTSNHGLSEALGLLVLAVELRGSEVPSELLDAWQVLGTHRLNQVINNTVFPGDGVQRERSGFYHNYELGLLLEVRTWLRDNDISLADVVPNRERPEAERLDFDPTLEPDEQVLIPGDADARLDAEDIARKMMDFAAAVTLPNGDVPWFGAGAYSSLRTYQHAVFESLFADESPEARRLAFVISGGEQGALPDPGARVFEDSGFVVLRSPSESEPERDAHVVFQAGFPAHSKAHPDALSVHLYGPGQDGRPGRVLLADSGWFSYRRPERRYFESTLAHNTVTIAHESQCMDEVSDRVATPGSDLGLRSCGDLRARYGGSLPGQPGYPAGAVEMGSTRSGAGWTYQSALHGLYPGVTHARAVVLGSAGWLLVLDEVSAAVEGEAPREAELYWHLGTDLQAQPSEARSSTISLAMSSSMSSSMPSTISSSVGRPHVFGGPASASVSVEVRELGTAGDVAAACRVIQGSCADAACTIPLQGFLSSEEDAMLAAPVLECDSTGQRVTWASFIVFDPLLGRAGLTRIERLPMAGTEAGEELRVSFDIDGVQRVLRVTSVGQPGESVQIDG